ncbi:hypothetical protein S1OALGB6SA_328 [Olavius algarvensis spirochete endosymbiont]|uniref:ATP-binding protein n=1 Tax=Olavius algarvensis spirochete endosymbiont TaxID=260710 RepID=UPI000F1690AD|nr:ATP-binding protein [Olavius algarvensis spirochete endosymbiont]VDA99265.1 hypothetical protein S1OALGB6SA_328 [Olavius algarvensis spirochete endosymbiont]
MRKQNSRLHTAGRSSHRDSSLKGLTSRLLIFNILLAVFPIGAVLFLGTYETQLLESQERAMVQQGRLLASALSGHNLAKEANAIIGRLGARTDARLRVIDKNGLLLADSASPIVQEQSSIRTENTQDSVFAPSRQSYPEENVIYRIGAIPTRVLKLVSRIIRKPKIPSPDAEYYSGKQILNGSEINSALEGRYGAITRISKGQKSVTLYSAIPIFQDEKVVGAVLASRSTLAILSDLYKLRLDIATIFLFSVAGAIVLSILLARTVTVPVSRLRDQAESILDQQGKMQSGFKPLSGNDEVADLSRALYRLSSRLQQRTDYVEDFMMDLMHEMKNPVAGILSAAELAEQNTPGETSRFLEVIAREGHRIQRLLDDLKELISVDVRLNQGEEVMASVGTILENIVSTYNYRKDKEVQVLLVNQSDSANPIQLLVNPDRLAQAILNLLDNAVSFSPRNEKVEIILDSPNKDTVKISVADRGPGIAEDVKEKVFERWYTDRPDQESSQHTGLGLAIVRRIAEGYGGGVQAIPRERGGTIFELEFPITK